MLLKTNQVEKIIQLDGFSVEKRSLWLHQFWLFVLWFTGELDNTTEKTLIELCQKESALFIQIETNSYQEEKIQTYKQFQPWFYKKFITPYTAVIDLNQDIDEILAKMKPKGRYNIRLTEKKWIVTQRVEKTDENIQKFYDLMLETTSRDNFSWNTFQYYKTFLDEIHNSELILSWKDEQVIAGWIFVFSKEESIYYYGASTSKKEYRNMMAPYAVQYFALNYAKKQWSKLYDFLWIAWPDEKNSELSWVTDFKLKITKDTRNVSESFIWINKRFHYTMLVLIRKIKKILRK